MEKRYSLISDGDGHWFICPADKMQEADEYFQAVEKYYSNIGNYKRKEPPEEPDFLKTIGGSPSLVTFTDPLVNGDR